MEEIAFHGGPHVSSNEVMVVTLRVGHIVHKSRDNIFASGAERFVCHMGETVMDIIIFVFLHSGVAVLMKFTGENVLVFLR